jgi:hypothetical protein
MRTWTGVIAAIISIIGVAPACAGSTDPELSAEAFRALAASHSTRGPMVIIAEQFTPPRVETNEAASQLQIPRISVNGAELVAYFVTTTLWDGKDRFRLERESRLEGGPREDRVSLEIFTPSIWCRAAKLSDATCRIFEYEPEDPSAHPALYDSTLAPYSRLAATFSYLQTVRHVLEVLPHAQDLTAERLPDGLIRLTSLAHRCRVVIDPAKGGIVRARWSHVPNRTIAQYFSGRLAGVPVEHPTTLIGIKLGAGQLLDDESAINPEAAAGITGAVTRYSAGIPPASVGDHLFDWKTIAPAAITRDGSLLKRNGERSQPAAAKPAPDAPTSRSDESGADTTLLSAGLAAVLLGVVGIVKQARERIP